MLFRRDTLAGIAEGRITLAFRRWRRPSVKAGGSLLTSAGLLAIETVEAIAPEAVSEEEAARAGYATRDLLLRELAGRSEGRLYRIAFRLAGPDPRAALRAADRLDAAAVDSLRQALRHLDESSRQGAWTLRALRLVAQAPGRKAAELAGELGFETARFKQRLRRLKALGLTESLATGYRLSPRGAALLRALPPREG